MKIAVITLSLAIVCAVTSLAEASSYMYANTALGVVEYTDFDASTQTIIASGLGTAARGIDVDSQGNVYAGFYDSGKIYRFDRNPDGSLNPNYYLYATGCGALHSITFDSNDIMYVGDYSSKVYKIDTSTWVAGGNASTSAVSFSSPGGTHGVSIDSEGYLYVNAYESTTYKYTSTGTLLGAYTTHAAASTVILDDKLYTVSTDIYMVDLATGATVPAPGSSLFISGISGGAWDFEVDENGDLYVSSYASGNIYHYDENGNPVGDGIFDSGVSAVHYMTTWNVSSGDESAIPEPVSAILLSIGTVSLLAKKRNK